MAAFYEEVIGDGSSDSRLVLFGTCDPAQLPATVATGECVLFQDSTDSNKPKLKFGTTVIDLTTVGGGETNTGSNQGTDGVGVYDTKSGQDLQFRHIAPGSTKITVTLNGKDIDLDIAEGNIVHQNLSGAGTNTHAQIDAHIADMANPHGSDIGNLGSGTLAELNAAVTDATLDDASASRTPSAHAIASHSDTTATGAELETLTDGSNADLLHAHAAPAHSAVTGKTANDHHNQQHALGGGDHTSATLAQLNALVSDATLDDSGDARTPSSHAASHASAGGDPIKLDDLAAPDDNTDLDATTSAHGLLPKLPGGTTNFLRADGSFAAPPGAGGGEVNDGANVGTAGVGLFKVKSGLDLQFKKLNAGSSRLSVTDDTGNDEVDLDVVEANLTITESQISDLGTYQPTSQKDAANGYVGLSAGSKIAGTQQTYGTGVSTACEGNDSRLSDARTPTAHTVASHSDTTATGAELETLTDGSNADALHVHAAPSHTVASHSDTTATGAELETLTDGSNADALHVHDTAGLADGAVTLAKQADLAADRIIGRANGAGTGVPTALTKAQVLTILNVEDGAAADQSAAEVAFTPDGDIAASTVQAAVVEVRDDTDTKLAGKAASSHTHVEADISDLGTYQPTSEKNAANGYAGLSAGSKLTGSQQTYGTGVNTACEGNDSRLSDSRAPNGSAGGDLTGTYPNPTIGSGNVSLAKMADLAADRIIGRANGAGTGAPTALTAAQVRTILGLRSLIETCREKDWDFSFSDCAVNVPADGGPDTNNAAIDSIKFDNSTEEGRHITVHVPTWATGLKLTTKSHADGAGGGTAAMRLYERELGASITAWSTAISLGNVTSGTDENYDSTEFDNTLATLGLTAGSTHQLQLTRNGGTLSTDLEVVAVTLEWYE